MSLGELVRLSLAKVALFYVMLLATLAGLLGGKAERRVLLVASLGGIPVLAFGVSWQGGDVERYMPAYPLVFAAWAMVLGGTRPMPAIQALVLLFVVVMSAVISRPVPGDCRAPIAPDSNAASGIFAPCWVLKTGSSLS